MISQTIWGSLCDILNTIELEPLYQNTGTFCALIPLSPFISLSPPITYRRTRSLKDVLVHSEFTGEFRKDPCKCPGTFRCGGCGYCHYMCTGSTNGRIFKPTHYANGKTVGVIYMLSRQCRSFYVGKTKQEFHKRVCILSMRKSSPDLPVGRHVRYVHGGKFPQIKFLILDWIHPSTQGGDWNRLLLQCETR